jgi:hypothetical protein
MRRLLLAALAATAWIATPAAGAQVLRVGTYHGIPGQFRSIQAAVNAARSGDWILVAPGDYKTSSSRAPQGFPDRAAGIMITTPGLRLRGMNRKSVIVDGTKPGSPRCSSAKSDQNFGPNSKNGPLGLNGILIWKADDVWVQNLTACNFLIGPATAGTNTTGNQIWWNGGDSGGQIGGWGYNGAYLTATSTFYENEANAAGYGIFSSNWSGGTWDHSYASNMNDSGFYIGACQQQCDQMINHAWAEFNALGYSGTNSGGQLVIQNSQFDNNEDGFDTNSENNTDWPSPQDGSCPNGAISPITHTHSCWVFMNNYVHDNNNPNVPSAGPAAAGPVGTGMSVSGGRNDTVMDNRFVHNAAWGVIFVPYPDSETPPPQAPYCAGGTQNLLVPCLYDESGNALIDNTFSGNGSYGNPSNGDFAQFNLEPGPTNCYRGNTDAGATARSSPSNLQQTYPSCNGNTVAPNLNPTFLGEVACDSQQPITPLGGSPCLPTDHYPRRTKVEMHPLPRGLETMPHPCSGVPSNPWCSGQVTRVGACVGNRVSEVLLLAVRERWVNLTVTLNGVPRTFKVRGRAVRIIIYLPKRRDRVKFLERIRVGSHLEKVSFTRIYHRC